MISAEHAVCVLWTAEDCWSSISAEHTNLSEATCSMIWPKGSSRGSSSYQVWVCVRVCVLTSQLHLLASTSSSCIPRCPGDTWAQREELRMKNNWNPADFLWHLRFSPQMDKSVANVSVVQNIWEIFFCDMLLLKSTKDLHKNELGEEQANYYLHSPASCVHGCVY